MSEKVNYYRFYCQTESLWKYSWGTSNPTVCPTNGAHTITSSSISVIKTISNKGRSTIDDRQEVAVTVMPSHHRACFIARADSVTGGTRGTGERFFISMTGGSDATGSITFQLVDPFDLVGGMLTCEGAGINDTVRMEVYAPASPATAATGVGNCNVVYGRIIPSPLNDGNYNINLSEAINSNVDGTNPLKPRLITRVTPVPAMAADGVTPNGYFEYDETTGQVTVSANPGSAPFNLYAMELTLTRYITDWPVYAGTSGLFRQEFKVVQKGGHLLPHWRFRCTVTRTADHDPADEVTYFWGWYISRQFTV